MPGQGSASGQRRLGVRGLGEGRGDGTGEDSDRAARDREMSSAADLEEEEGGR